METKLAEYLIFRPESGRYEHFLSNNINVLEMVYESPQVLGKLLGFLNSQADQYERIIFNLQEDNFHLIMNDPRNGSGQIIPSVYHETNTQGVGIMYRIIDVANLFTQLKDHHFGHYNGRLAMNIQDSFLPINENRYAVAFDNGRPTLLNNKDHCEIEITLDIAEFSSLLTGAVAFADLAAYGMAEISDRNQIDTVNDIFRSKQKPICYTPF